MKNSISILIVVFIISCVLGCGFGRENVSKSDTKEPQNTQSVSPQKENTAEEKPVRSTELVDAFKEDKDAANAKYKGKTILISGKITNINDVFGVKALNLRDAEDAVGLQTYLANSSDVEKVKVGDEVVVRGKVRGDGTDVIDNAVVVKVN